MFFLSDGTVTPGAIGRPDVPAQTIQKATCANMGLFGQVLTLAEMEKKLAA